MRHSRLFALLCALFATVLAGCNGGGVNLTTSNGAAASSSTSSMNLNAEEPVVEIRSVASAQPGGRRYVLNISGQTTTGSAYSHSNFVIKGGGLQGISQPPYGLQQFTYPYMALMAGNIGANCIRTYGAALSQQTPEQQKSDFSAALTWAATATSNGTPMYVAIGLTMLPSTQLDYTNTNAGSPLLTQRAGIQSLVDEAIALDNSRQLLWVIGNELAQSPHESVRTAVYNEIDVIAQYIKNKGSTLPCMTAVPAVSVAELKLIAASCTHLDVLGVNDYYGHFGTTAGGGFLNGLNSVMSTSHGAADGWQKPYIVSEFGSYDVPAVGSMPTAALPSPPPFTPAGVYGLEACSTQIAQDYLSNYQSYIQPFTSGGGTCLGSFAYVWENPVFSNNFAYFFEIFVTSH
ncbi:MAG: hypothetical protein FJX76_16385, partial [Armatimonadetes bacterium]|nr:hypothetical protein [Armatimonadota bacterium]